MRIGFVVNDIKTEEAGFTTSRLGTTAVNLGHEVWLMGVGDLALDEDDIVRARAVRAARSRYKTSESFLRDLSGKNGHGQRVTVDDLDVLLLRNEPAVDAVDRPWAASAGIVFGRIALRRGVIVLNDPDGLSKASNKMYLQMFPEEIRPRTLISRCRDDLKAFAQDQGGTIVLKPLLGSGGRNVFLLRPGDLPNINQMIDAVIRDGYVIAQEYVPAAAAGSMRLFLLNGQPLRYKGRCAAYRRVRSDQDVRSNIDPDGTLRRAKVTTAALNVAEVVRPKLVQDGMFLAALDIAGDKLIKIDVFRPDGLGTAQRFEGVNFCRAVIEAMERKTQYMAFHRRDFDNVELAAL
ncbi:MAG: glutathione synthetase [Planctomycetota bacterium]|jgi:glutathione synthase